VKAAVQHEAEVVAGFLPSEHTANNNTPELQRSLGFQNCHAEQCVQMGARHERSDDNLFCNLTHVGRVGIRQGIGPCRTRQGIEPVVWQLPLMLRSHWAEAVLAGAGVGIRWHKLRHIGGTDKTTRCSYGECVHRRIRDRPVDTATCTNVISSARTTIPAGRPKKQHQK
jgi:hypothetical protein